MRIIKKYSNRRLYDTDASRYLNLNELAALIRGGEEVKVVDTSSGEDLTTPVLLQALAEDAGDMLPPSMLHRIIRAGGDDPWHRALRQQIKTGMSLMSAQMDHLEKVFFQGRPTPPPPPQDGPDEPPPETPGAPDDELDELRARLAALEERLSRG